MLSLQGFVWLDEASLSASRTTGTAFYRVGPTGTSTDAPPFLLIRLSATSPVAPSVVLQANANTTSLTLVVNLEQRHVLSKALIPARRLVRARTVDTTTTAHRCGFNIAATTPVPMVPTAPTPAPTARGTIVMVLFLSARRAAK